MITTVIFDMDGVLIDSEPIHWKVNQDYFESIGTPVTEDHYSDNFVGLPLDQMLVQLKEKFNLPKSVEQMLKENLENLYEAFSTVPIEAVTGVTELIETLKKTNLNLAVGSSSDPALISIILKRIGLKNYFTHTVSGFEVERGKPEPDLFLHIAALFQVKPESCLVIEDSALGVLAARRAGMQVVGVQNGTSGNQDLSKADLVISGFSESERENLLKKFSLVHA